MSYAAHAADAAGYADAAAYAVRAAVSAVGEFSDPSLDPSEHDAVFSAAFAAVSADADEIDSGVPPDRLATQPLWLKGSPAWARANWMLLRGALEGLNEDWEVWTDWYQARTEGRRVSEALEVARVMIDEKFWEEGPKSVNAEIRRLVEEHRRLEREIFDSAFEDDNERDREAPEVPRPRAAAVEPLWDGSILTIPETPSPTDQSNAEFASALLGMRNVLWNFADEISNEANIDRRFVSFVRKVAEQIPEVAPPQYKLFEIGHVEAVFAEYTRTVNEQWPNFLAARYHAVVLQFDRTMRQSEAWRDFKRNAQEAIFTDQQTRKAAELANAAAAVLRNDEAGEFVDPLVSQVLEQLADPRSRLDDALATIEAGKGELAADLVESTNNIFKAIAEVALPVVMEAAAAARRTAGKTAEAFWKEFEKGAVAEAKARGKPRRSCGGSLADQVCDSHERCCGSGWCSRRCLCWIHETRGAVSRGVRLAGAAPAILPARVADLNLTPRQQA